MTVPGSNILKMALRVIAPQSFNYYAYTGRTKNAIGQQVTAFDPPISLRGSVQPVPRNLYQQYGLDFQRNYLVFYVSQNVIDVERDVSGDQFLYAGRRFQCLSKTDWFSQDGWDAILTVEVPFPTPPARS